MLSYVIELSLSVFCLWCALTARRDDGNIWGIYLEKWLIHVGDFWLALGFVYFLIAFAVDLSKLLKFLGWMA